MPLQPWGGNSFRTLHPDFNRFTLKFERLGECDHRRQLGPVNNLFGTGSAAPNRAVGPGAGEARRPIWQ